MKLFTRLFGDLLAFVYHCFDRVVIHGYLNGLSRPEQVVHFCRQVLGLAVVDKEVLSQRPRDYQAWVEAYAGNHRIPMEWAEKGSGANASVGGDDEGMQRFVPIEDLFKGRHFDRQIIVLCVSWYASFKLSLRDLVIMMADRGISVTHTTILRWVQRYLPEFEKRWRRYARPVGGSWRMDETYIKVHGQWVYLYRAVDKAGQTVDFFLSRNRDVNAAKSFLRSAMKNTRVPTKITLDAYAASHRAVREMKEEGELPCRVKVRSSQYLNNLVEQDHRRVKQRIRPMLGFKRFDNAVVTISGIELAEKIKKGQFKTGKLGGSDTTMTELWNAALAA
jgi:transposase-like protein